MRHYIRNKQKQIGSFLKLLNHSFTLDIILVSRKRHVLKRMRNEMFQILGELQLSLRYEKTFVGKSQKGFDLLGYHITPKNFSPSQKTQEKALENAKRRYAQGGKKSLVEYLNRWRTWIYAGLPFKVEGVDDVIKSIVDAVVKDTSFNPTQEQSCDEKQRNRTSESLDASQVNRSIISVPDGVNFNLNKGKVSCIKNFSGHSC